MPDARPCTTAVGYNIRQDSATAVTGTATAWSATQWELDTPGLADGSSGGPLLDRDGTDVVGVIGGHEQGGATADVSYAAAPGAALHALYAQVGGTD